MSGTENVAEDNRRFPPGISLIRRFGGADWDVYGYRYVVLLVTFIAYTAYHASRKPTSIVKSVLDPSRAKGNVTEFWPWPMGGIFIEDKNSTNGEGWAPFDDGAEKLGELDLAFLSFYAAGMYVVGHLGDNMDLRKFLTVGMICSGIFVGLFGMGYFWDIHDFCFYLITQMFAGLFQATGWPSVVAVIGNWFGQERRGLIMGVWNAHTSIGNISGSLLASSVLEYGWGWSFILPAAFICLSGIVVYLFLAAYPEDIGFPSPNGTAPTTTRAVAVSQDEEAQPQISNEIEPEAQPQILNAQEPQPPADRRGIGLLQACRIPGVIPFALCLFFTKLVAYTFLYWLPFYLRHTAIGGQQMSVKSAGNLSTLFDVGGIIGGIIAGYVSDRIGARATTVVAFMFLAIPALLLYSKCGSYSRLINVVLMMIAGLLVNGPYALITTAVSADLGTRTNLIDNARALATVTAIIDGTGSVGAALGPLLTGFLSERWDVVFYILIGCCFIAALLLTHLVVGEMRARFLPQQDNVSGTESQRQPLLSDRRQ